MAKISYSRGFPYGAPLVMLRGGATKNSAVKDFIREQGFRWDGSTYAWTHYLDRSDFGPILKTLRDEYGCEVVPKKDLPAEYLLDLDDENFSRPS